MLSFLFLSLYHSRLVIISVSLDLERQDESSVNHLFYIVPQNGIPLRLPCGYCFT